MMKKREISPHPIGLQPIEMKKEDETSRKVRKEKGENTSENRIHGRSKPFMNLENQNVQTLGSTELSVHSRNTAKKQLMCLCSKTVRQVHDLSRPICCPAFLHSTECLPCRAGGCEQFSIFGAEKQGSRTRPFFQSSALIEFDSGSERLLTKQIRRRTKKKRVDLSVNACFRLAIGALLLLLTRLSPADAPTDPPGVFSLAVSMKVKGDSFDELANSIDRSRKRHLEEGLLRGDQVRDRLRVQEASASPALKKTRKSPHTTPPDAPNMALTMADFREYMDKNTNKRLTDIDDKIGGMQEAIKDNTAKLQRHDSQIAQIREEMKKIRDPFPPPPTSAGPLAVTLPTPTATIDEEYLSARRSLRLWPIAGTTRDELWHAVGIFLGTNLGLEGKLSNSSVECITRVEIPSGPGVKLEVLVRFKDAGLRDLVMGSASKLAPFMDSEGRATAGMRIEVPPRLQQSFRVLFKYGRSLRARHGVGTRRHIKFCDVEASLYLNVKLPGDEEWSRVSLQVAARGIKAKENANDDQLERRLDITGPLSNGPRRRATSTTGPPPPTEASAWMRRGGSTSS